MVIAGAYGFYLYSLSDLSLTQNNKRVAYHSVTSDESERVQVRIKDGTKVVLNAASKISYPNDFGTSSRVIYLEGEAYFEVNSDHPHPFVVYANGVRIEDISTKFNIKSYQDQENSEVVVSEGKVKVSSIPKESEKHGKEERSSTLLLSQGQMVKIGDNTSNKFHVEKANLNQALGWLRDQLVFDAQSLSQIITQLESHYNIKVIVKNSNLLNKRITTSFSEESLENVIKVLAISIQANYSIEGDTVKFYN